MKEKSIHKVVIAGAGLMGAGISQIFPEYEIDTILYSLNKADFERASDIIQKDQRTLIENGKITEEQSRTFVEKITFTVDKNCFSDADLIIEAIPEILPAKQAFYEEISSLTRKNTIITSNTSAISIDRLSNSVKYPERFCGTHFLNPPHIIPLVEITKGAHTDQDVCNTLYQLFKKMQKEPVLLRKDVKGFLSNRLQFALLREATYLVEHGIASVEDIDRTIRYGNGLRYTCSGPFKIADLGGLSVFNEVAKYLYPDLSNENECNHLMERLVNNGDTGIYSGKGFYEYDKSDQENEEKLRDTMIFGILELEQKLSKIK